MNVPEYRFLLSERATLEKMLDEISPKSVIGRMSLEQRKEEVEERIAAFEEEPAREVPPPITDHAAHSAALLAHAQEMIDKGDRLQASEKIWGAVAHKLKDIARKRGWSWRKHGAYNALVGYLRRETRNPELGTLFRSADSLHANFYDDQYEQWQLEDGLADAKRLIALLDEADAAVPQDAPLPRGLRRLTPESDG